MNLTYVNSQKFKYAYNINSRKWYSSVKSEVGFTEESFLTLEKKAEDEKKEGRDVSVSLMFDEVSIRKKIEWNGKQFIGGVDLGLSFFRGRGGSSKNWLASFLF